MSVVPLTLTISLCLVFTFVVFFLREHNRRNFGSAESDALMPLADEMARTDSKSDAVVLDLGNRLPKRRHGGCGKAHDHDHKACEGCTNHGHHDHA